MDSNDFYPGAFSSPAPEHPIEWTSLKGDVTYLPFFFYGIFLGESTRQRYGIIQAQYDTVRGYLTTGDYIVQAVRTDIEGAALTGVTAYVPTTSLLRLDNTEAGYKRIEVTTTSGDRVYMYVHPDTPGEDYSLYNLDQELREELTNNAI